MNKEYLKSCPACNEMDKWDSLFLRCYTCGYQYKWPWKIRVRNWLIRHCLI